jgi:tetratricopeptide (TPR) repeat protein
MVDLSKHLQRARAAIDKRSYDLALEVCLECQEIDPANLDNYRLLLEAAKRKAAEVKTGFFGTMGMPALTKDPHKLLSAAVRKIAKTPDIKSMLAAGDAARGVAAATKNKAFIDVAILIYEEGKSGGLFNGDLLWNLGHAYHDRFAVQRDRESLDKAIACMQELERAKSNPDAARAGKNWEAEKSMVRRAEVGNPADYRNQVNSVDASRRNEVMGRMIRSVEDAREVLKFVDDDLAKTPKDKGLLLKKGDVHRRINELAPAREAYTRAREVDPHDFTIHMRMGDIDILEMQIRIKEDQAAGRDTSEARRRLQEREIQEYRMRADRQPTEMSHQFALGSRLYQKGDIDPAAASFQKSVNDPRFKRQSHHYLGHCFAAKQLLDLSAQQYSLCLSLIEDDLSEEAKEVRYSRAKAYEALDKANEALTDYTKLVEIDLGFKDCAQRLTALRKKLGL